MTTAAAPISHHAAHTAKLVPHPDSRAAAARGVHARVCRAADGWLTVRYVLEEPAHVLVPSPRPMRFADGLWAHTCFELFIACRSEAAYHELNFSPSGEWAAYAFEGYRRRVGLAEPAFAPQLYVRSGAMFPEVEASIALARLSPAYASAALAVGLSAVIEAPDRTLSYWALAHPQGKPDFHHRDAFALELA
jgi:hypothetical protein